MVTGMASPRGRWRWLLPVLSLSSLWIISSLWTLWLHVAPPLTAPGEGIAAAPAPGGGPEVLGVPELPRVPEVRGKVAIGHRRPPAPEWAPNLGDVFPRYDRVNLTVPFHTIRKAGRQALGNWSHVAATVADAGHPWCSLIRDNWACAGPRYGEVLRETPLFDRRFDLNAFPADFRIYADGNSLTAQLIHTIVCNTDGVDAWVLRGAEGENSLLAKAPSGAKLLFWGHGDTLLRSPAESMTRVKRLGFKPDYILHGQVNYRTKEERDSSRREHQRLYTGEFPNAFYLKLANEKLPFSCQADFQNCGASAGKNAILHQCLPGPRNTVAQELSEFVLGHIKEIGANPVLSQSMLRHSEERSLPHLQPLDRARQRIVVFIGPHKTGANAIQKNLYRWMRAPSFRDWSYPIPLSMKNIKHPEKSPLVNFGKSLWYPEYEKNCNLATTVYNTKPQGMPCPDVRALFAREFAHQWRDRHKSLLLVSEAFDSVAREAQRSSPEDLLRTLPWDEGNDKAMFSSDPAMTKDSPQNQGRRSDNKLSRDDITVVVNYRSSPRSAHLVSHWRQCCHGVTFREYLFSEKLMIGLKTVDSLYLAERFLDAGLGVVLIDLAGARTDGRNTATVIACQVMQVPCVDSNRTVSGVEPPAETDFKAERGDMGDVTETQLDAIDAIIKRRDCHFRHLLEREQFEVLYGDAFLLQTWSGWCTSAAATGSAFGLQAVYLDSGEGGSGDYELSPIPLLDQDSMQEAIRKVIG